MANFDPKDILNRVNESVQENLQNIQRAGAEFDAKELYRMLESQIRTAQADAAREALQLAVFYHPPYGAPVTVEAIGYQGNSMVILDGVDLERRWTRILLHTANLQLVMKRVPVASDRPKKAIRFAGEHREGNDEGGSREPSAAF